MIIRRDPKIRFANPDPTRVPPGQFVTTQWPVLHAGGIPHVDLATWKFSIWGRVERIRKETAPVSRGRERT